MVVLLNIVFGLLAGWIVNYILAKAGVNEPPIRVTIAVIAGVFVFLLNIAAEIVT